MALSIALAVNNDPLSPDCVKWHGYPILPGFHSIYLCGEDDVGAEENFRALCKIQGLSTLPPEFHFYDILADLMDDAKSDKWAIYLKEKIGDHRAVVFLDTWQRATASGSQSDEKDRQKTVDNAEKIAKAVRGSIVAAAHPPKDGRMTWHGSVIGENASTGIWHLEPDGDQRKLKTERVKGCREGIYRIFELKEELSGGKDEFGRARTGLYPKCIGGIEFSGSIVNPYDIHGTLEFDIKQAVGLFIEDYYFRNKDKPFFIKTIADQLINMTIDRAGQPCANDAGFAFKGSKANSRVLTTMFMTPCRLGEGRVLSVESEQRGKNIQKRFIHGVEN